MEKSNTGILKPRTFTKEQIQNLKAELIKIKGTVPKAFQEASNCGYDIESLIPIIEAQPDEFYFIAPNGDCTVYRLDNDYAGNEEYHYSALKDYIETNIQEDIEYTEEDILEHGHFMLRPYLSFPSLTFNYIVGIPSHMTDIQKSKMIELCSKFCRPSDIKTDPYIDYQTVPIRHYYRKLYEIDLEKRKER